MPSFRDHLARQLQFLAASSKAFDDGFEDEAYRIAVALRVLIQKTARQTPLLEHVGAPDALLLSTTEPPPSDCISYNGLAMFVVENRDGTYITSFGAGLDDAPHRRYIPADEWWNEIVHVLNGKRMSRKGIALSAAEQDGGAHVDTRLNQAYQEFKESAWVVTDGTSRIDVSEQQLIFLRQMAWEILNSPSLQDLVAMGAIQDAHKVPTRRRFSWEPPEVEAEAMAAVTVSEVDRLRPVVSAGHFKILDQLYKQPQGTQTDPIIGFQVDFPSGSPSRIDQWLASLLSENLLTVSRQGAVEITMRGRAFVARVIEIGH